MVTFWEALSPHHSSTQKAAPVSPKAGSQAGRRWEYFLQVPIVEGEPLSMGTFFKRFCQLPLTKHSIPDPWHPGSEGEPKVTPSYCSPHTGRANSNPALTPQQIKQLQKKRENSSAPPSTQQPSPPPAFPPTPLYATSIPSPTAAEELAAQGSPCSASSGRPPAGSLAGLSPRAGSEAEQEAFCRAKGWHPPRVTLTAGTQASTAVHKHQGHLQDAPSCTEQAAANQAVLWAGNTFLAP